jgi:hypothetical protein
MLPLRWKVSLMKTDHGVVLLALRRGWQAAPSQNIANHLIGNRYPRLAMAAAIRS